MKFKTLLFVVLLGFSAACQNSRPLAPAGVYGQIAAQQGEPIAQQLIKIDQAIDGAYSIIDKFLLWESKTRTALVNDPAITKFANKLRREAPKALQSAVAIRDTFAGEPTEANRTRVTAALDVVEALLLEVAKYRATTIKTQ